MITRIVRGLALVCFAATSDSSEVPACDLANPEIAGFLTRVRLFYERSVFELSDVERVSRFLDRRDELLAVCPAAVLQALLIKLEENQVYEDRAYEALMSTYVRYMHAAMSKGTLNRADLREWPLADGLERVSAMNTALATRRDITTAMVMNYCKSSDRFGVTHELQWLLEPPFGSPLDQYAAGTEMGLLQHTDLYIYLVDKPWCSRPSELVLQNLRRSVRELHLVSYLGGPEREEQSAYFKFLADHYDNLPDFTIFTHPDAPEHQGSEFVALRRVLRLLHTNSEFAYNAIGYWPIANQIVVDPKRTWGKRFAAEWRPFWRAVFGRPWSEHGYKPPRCRWDSFPATYISGFAPGAGEGDRLSRPAAKTACTQAEECEGVTCGTPLEPEEMTEAILLSARLGSSCSARQGAPSGLYESPTVAEVSYVRHCTDKGSTTHDDGFVHDEIEAPEDTKGPVAPWTPPDPAPEGASDVFQCYTGSQSVVRRDRLLAWPREQYETWAADGPFCSANTGSLEAVWHVMFGEPLSQWPREHDPRAPLYLKWFVGTMYSFGDEGVI